MPRVTKAQLEAQVATLERKIATFEDVVQRREAALRDARKENEQLKTRISRGHDRSRSPRRPATSAEANVELTCRALRQVSLWQQDTVVQEHRDEIQQLREELAKKDKEIASMRRGEGPIGEVLLNAYARRFGLGDNELDRWQATNLRRQTTPVHEFVDRLQRIHSDLADVTRGGGTIWAPSTIPRRM
jgi:DNA repair exonuclease SbcCD ATPase subunit